MLTLTFDDCYKNQKDIAENLLKHAKLKASFYVITDYLEEGAYPDYMKRADILSLVQDGHEISSHTQSHPRLTEISKEKVVEELTGSKHVLQDLGIEAKTFVYPYGDHDQRVVEEVRHAGYTCARTTVFGYNDRKTNPYMLKCQPVYRWVPFFVIAYWIRKAERKNLWLILMFHQLDTVRSNYYGTTPKMFERIVRYISERKIQTVTMEEGVTVLDRLRI
jgi:peptidoglycan/xylan/chitin deacetylase (PgdA/CDA1 family)